VTGLDDLGWSTVIGQLVMTRTGAARFLDLWKLQGPGSNGSIGGGKSVYSAESSRIVAAVRTCGSECAAEQGILVGVLNWGVVSRELGMGKALLM